MNFPDFKVMVPVLLTPTIMDGLTANFPLWRLWEAPDRQALLAEVAGSVRGIATGASILASGPKQPIDAAFLRRFPNLEIVASMGVGYDQIDVQAAGHAGVIVTNTPGVLDDEVAATALGLLLCTVRQLPQAERYLRAGKWKQGPYPLSPTLNGRTLGILGLGRIGKAIAKRAETFGMKIIYHGREAQPEVEYPYFPTVEGLARTCDILLVAAPGGPETNNMVDKTVLEALGPDGVLINISRGSLVDEPALIAALRDGTIQAAGLDVFAHEPNVPAELIAMENVVLLPHVGSGSVQTRQAMSQLVVDNLVSWASEKGPLTPVKETPWPAPIKGAK